MTLVLYNPELNETISWDKERITFGHTCPMFHYLSLRTLKSKGWEVIGEL